MSGELGNFMSGGGLNMFFQGRNVHQDKIARKRCLGFLSTKNWEKETTRHPAPARNLSLPKEVGATEEEIG